MKPETFGILIGGLLPAVLFGFCNVVAKFGAQQGISAGAYMVIAGIGVTVSGAALWFTQSGGVPMTGSTIGFAFLYGILWGISSGLVMFALLRYRVPMSKLVPLFNMNTLVSVALILWIFAEWQSVNVLKLLIGVIFVVLGGTLVALA